MDRLTPPHHRKAGSGPPANALIAWIGTDPYLREAAATASYQRELALPPPSRTRSAKMAVVVCFVLACGAVLGITTIISHGRSAVQNKIVTSSPGQVSATASAPVGIAPMLAYRAAPGPTAAPPASQQAGDEPGSPRGTSAPARSPQQAPAISINPDELTYSGDGRDSGDTAGPIGLDNRWHWPRGQSDNPDTEELSASGCQPPV